jgi:putative endonuclease
MTPTITNGLPSLKAKLMAEHNDLGKRGEAIAKDFMVKNGYQLVEQNWQYNHRELDLIMWEIPHELLVFIEVKTRSTHEFGYPETAITEAKRQFLIEAANEYLDQNQLDCELRFDVIAILLKDQTVKDLTHIKDAVIP